jgi:hypothetical protein
MPIYDSMAKVELCINTGNIRDIKYIHLFLTHVFLAKLLPIYLLLWETERLKQSIILL